MSDLGIVWEDPPQTSAHQRAMEHNKAILAELMAHPGEWARVASYVQAGNAGTWLRWGCEVRRARTAKNAPTCHIWARWPGDLS